VSLFFTAWKKFGVELMEKARCMVIMVSVEVKWCRMTEECCTKSEYA
jgi:hypothetical protein